MKRNIIVCGLIAGLILTAMMIGSTAYCYKNENFEGNMVFGYTVMILAFSLIFVGIKNFRDKYNQGLISFGKAFKIGAYITLVASTMYVIVWLFEYYLFIPDFMDVYAAHVINQAKSAGSTVAEISAKTEEMATYKEMYKNPLFVIFLTYTEVLPIGLIVSAISALILKKQFV